MIEINLLPGARKKSKAAGAGFDFAAAFKGVVARVTDPYLLSAVGAAVVAVLVVGFMYLTQSARERDLTEREQKAAQDSTRYAAVLREKARAEAQRDTVIRQLNIIRSIDNNRYVWPHLLDEVARALPPFTWLSSVIQTSTPVSAAAATVANPAAARPAGAPAADARSSVDTIVVEDTLRFRLVGNTIDVQALTRFMTLLEASPFVKNVVLVKLTPVIEDDRQIAEFQLDAEYQKPDSSSIRVLPALPSAGGGR